MGDLKNAEQVRERIVSLGKPERALGAQRFFKSGPGEYGEGDVFVGVCVPDLRNVAREGYAVSVEDCVRLLHDPVHEVRFVALLLLVHAFQTGDERQRERVYGLYLKNTSHINNWDLVDVSAEHIVGAYLLRRNKAPLDQLAKSPVLWERRIAVLATFHAVKREEFADTLRIAAMLLDDAEDLIHKAVGWMLREVGKRDQQVLESFLSRHGRSMPRTMLRYAIERFPESLRLQYLRGGPIERG